MFLKKEKVIGAATNTVLMLALCHKMNKKLFQSDFLI